MQTISLDTLKEKYTNGCCETIEQIKARVSTALAEEKEQQVFFLEALNAGFIPAGRIMSTAGTDRRATLINCFVQPIGDSMKAITEALGSAAETMRRGGGVGYNFSAIRPKGALVKGTNSRASGPISYMRMFNVMCATVESAGARRGAQMGMLNVDHPDILEFIHAKDSHGEFKHFNFSVAITNAFMEAVEADDDWDLVHDEMPADCHGTQREDRKWVYETLPARKLFDAIMQSTYDHAEPGVIFIDRVNAENNLGYCEEIEATNPCAEQPLPHYGCCCLGSINLTLYVKNPFTERASFDFVAFQKTAGVAVRMLDRVLDTTYWPLSEQQDEAAAKRRIGLGFLGLGDALIMLGLRYDSVEARRMAVKFSEALRDTAYLESIEIAKEKGAFPLFDADEYLAGAFAKRLPKAIRHAIKDYGIRNSHLLSIAPTGTISLAFADNASNGIEPPFAWKYDRKKIMQDGNTASYAVEDHAYRMYRKQGGDVDNLPDYFVSALEINVADHVAMVAAVQPYIDSAISKTVNVPEDYPFEDFKNLYLQGWRNGAKGLATYRPNSVTGAILSVSDNKSNVSVSDIDQTDPDRRISLKSIPEPALNTLRWRKRPRPVEGNPAWTYMLEGEHSKFAVFVGHLENGQPEPFEVWVNGGEQPRGIGALAKSLSMDMRSEDRAWLKTKLASLLKTPGDEVVHVGENPMPSAVAALAKVVLDRCEKMGVFNDTHRDTPVLDALMSAKEPKTGSNGTMGWMVDIRNPNTGDDFVIGVKELVLPNGQLRPYSLWLSGNYPRALDGLCKSLSFDMRVIDPAWVGGKLRQLRSFAEPAGDFFAKIPGSEKQQVYPSTVGYLAQLIMHRFAMLGILDEDGLPIEAVGIVTDESGQSETPSQPAMSAIYSRKACQECGCYTLIRKDGCDFCTSCGATGACG